MPIRPQPSFPHVAATHFVPCFFMGILLMYVLNALMPGTDTLSALTGSIDPVDLARAAINGAAVSALAVVFHHLRDRKLARLGAGPEYATGPRTMLYAGIIGFAGGAMDVLMVMQAGGILVMTLLVLTLLALNLRAFARHILVMLAPDTVATWSDVSEMLRIYLTMLAGFTLVNATLEGVHLMARLPAPFGFMADGGDIFLNSLYFTVVTMTTLGFGDIVPHTWDGKLLLIFQCLVSYAMFALMVGIVTRGVARIRNHQP